MKRVELLAPAGDLDKLKTALLYGADAVFVGGKSFSLRAKASNFSDEDLIEGVRFAHSLNKKVHVTVNVIPEDEELTRMKEYVRFLSSIGVDAVIVSSLAIMKFIKDENLPIEIHVSTQCSSSNSLSVDFYKSFGASRVVLGRECSLKDISSIINKTDLEIETFIHGGLCAGISGRCHLSDFYCSRKANRGACAHSCRWSYNLSSIDKENTFLFGCKDLCAIEFIPDLIKAGVSSFKIEGRMKSLHYIASVVRAYRLVIDNYYNGSLNEEIYEKAYSELAKCESRNYGASFFKGLIYPKDMAYEINAKTSNKEFVGYFIKKGEEVLLYPKALLNIETEYELINPYSFETKLIKLTKLYDHIGEFFDTRHVKDYCNVIVNEDIDDYYILRKVNKD